MKIDVVTMKGERKEAVDLPADIFEAPINIDLMHQAYTLQMANARLGTHKTKTRGEVSGGGRKPWRQKGTGRSRHGSIRSVQWKGGGRAHGPRPRKYTKRMPRQMRRAALRSALSSKAADSSIVIVDEVSLPEAKTRLMYDALRVLIGDSSALILIPGQDENYRMIVQSTNNIADVKVLMANYLNIRDILGYEKLVMSLKALDVLKEFLAQEAV